MLHSMWDQHVPQPGLKPTSPAVEAQSPNYRTPREVPLFFIINICYIKVTTLKNQSFFTPLGLIH